MRSFGRKSNQQSTKPDVPPELRPYYDAQSAKGYQRVRLVAATAVPVLVFILAIVAGVWLYHHYTSQPSTSPSKQTTQSAQQNNQSQSKPSTGSSSNTPQNGVHNQSAPTSAQPQPSQSEQSQPASTPSASGAIPSTGTGTNILLAALGIGVLGAAVNYIRQLRLTQG
jgi:cytoskeletal protein RodZ